MPQVISKLLNPFRSFEAQWDRLTQRAYANRLRSMVGRNRWCLGNVEWDEKELLVSGWALPPVGGHSRLDFRVNSQSFEIVEYPQFRKDVGDTLWFIPGAAESGFTCRISVRQLDSNRSDDLILQAVDLDASSRSAPYCNHYFPGEGRTSAPLPSPIRMQRVHGSSVPTTFRYIGYSAFVQMEQALRERFGKGYSDFPRILDWGCGSGRITRYFERRPRARVVGIDIDQDNIEWCRENLPFATFETVPLHPPTQLPAGSFDLLIGTSIFTHLQESEQFHWLDELRRLSAPGATLLMSCHGRTSVGYGRMALKPFREWSRQGFLDCGACELAGVRLSESDYYRSTYHSERYVRRHWSKYFEIVEYLPAFIGNLQDLVVMRRP